MLENMRKDFFWWGSKDEIRNFLRLTRVGFSKEKTMEDLGLVVSMLPNLPFLLNGCGDFRWVTSNLGKRYKGHS